MRYSESSQILIVIEPLRVSLPFSLPVRLVYARRALMISLLGVVDVYLRQIEVLTHTCLHTWL